MKYFFAIRLNQWKKPWNGTAMSAVSIV